LIRETEGERIELTYRQLKLNRLGSIDKAADDPAMQVPLRYLEKR